MSECTTNPVKRRITRRSQMLASACLLIYLGTSQLATRTTGPFSMALAVIAGLSIFGEVFFVGNMVLTLRDEFQQILLTRSFVWATVITMGIVTVWGFVELHGRDSVPISLSSWSPSCSSSSPPSPSSSSSASTNLPPNKPSKGSSL